MNLNVWLRTLTSAMVCSIFGMWQATHSLPGAACLVMRVCFDGRGARAVRRIRAVALQAEHVGRLQQVGIVLRAVNVVATEAGDAVRVHHALHKIVALHAVLVRGAVGEMREASSRRACALRASRNRCRFSPTWKPTGQS